MTRRTLTEEIIAGERKLRNDGSEILRPYDEDGLPPEPFSSFTESPLDFEEMTLTLYKDLQEVYELTGILNRFSRNYPVACRLLEQLIKRLGSCLVTKAAMEQKDFIFPHLQDLSIEDLYRMISFNFRKTHVAFREGKEKRGCADMSLLEQECRLADLAERLRATEEKIRQIKAGKVDVDSLLERAKFYRDRRHSCSSKNRLFPTCQSPGPAGLQLGHQTEDPGRQGMGKTSGPASQGERCPHDPPGEPEELHREIPAGGTAETGISPDSPSSACPAETKKLYCRHRPQNAGFPPGRVRPDRSGAGDGI